MNTIENSRQEQSKKARIPRWMALMIALAFWIVGIPLFYGVGPWALSVLTPHFGWIAGRPSLWNLLGFIPLLIASLCLIWIMLLHFAPISAVPERIERELTPRHLLSGGPYAFTRNPMYLAELTLLLGWALYYGSILVFIGVLLGWFAFNFVIVPREECNLEARFGEAYLEYKNKVPRWF
jgi:protein-S-isoprenylcysteine O-methyltransferase Ste14